MVDRKEVIKLIEKYIPNDVYEVGYEIRDLEFIKKELYKELK